MKLSGWSPASCSSMILMEHVSYWQGMDGVSLQYSGGKITIPNTEQTSLGKLGNSLQLFKIYHLALSFSSGHGRSRIPLSAPALQLGHCFVASLCLPCLLFCSLSLSTFTQSNFEI